jgi:hypothetical protein
MTLADVSLPCDLVWAQAHALIFGTELALRLAEVQAAHGDPRHRPYARQLADGRYMLAADILLECIPGGLVYGGFSQLDSARFGEIQVMPWADAVALLPPDPPEPTAPASSPTLSPAAAPSGGGTLAPGVAPSLGGAIVR